MYKLHLSKNKYGYYEALDCNTQEPWILYLFLTSDVSDIYESFLEIAYAADFFNGCSNATLIEKEKEYIYLSDGIFDYNEPMDTNPLKLKIPIEQYVYLLETWGTKICIKDKRPSQVIIYYANEEFTFDIKP